METLHRHAKKILLITGFLVALGTFFYGTLLYRLDIKADRAAQLRGNIADATRAQETSLALANFLRITEAARDELDGYFIESDTIVSFIERVEATALHSGTGISFQAVEIKNKEAPVLHVEFNLNGNFGDLIYFLKLLELLPYELHVESVRLAKGRESLAMANREWEGGVSLTLLNFIEKQK